MRTRARRLAMQALYQWDMSGNNLSEIEVQFLEDEDFSKADKDYFFTSSFTRCRHGWMKWRRHSHLIWTGR